MMGGFGMGFGWIIFILIIVLLLVGKGYFNRSREEGESPKESALHVLKERYARGEISKEEFEGKKRDLA
jgi:putative membrane protein